MQAQLEDRVGFVTGLLLQFHEVVDVIRIEHERFLANDIAPQAQTVADKRVVGIVWRADADPMQGVIGAHLLGAETVELFVFGKERAIGER